MDRLTKKYMKMVLPLMLICASCGCAGGSEETAQPAETEETAAETKEETASAETENMQKEENSEEETGTPDEAGTVSAGNTARGMSLYTDENGDSAMIPDRFTVSAKEGEQTIRTGLVVIAPDESEYVWVPTDETTFVRRDYGSYFSFGSSFSSYTDETDLAQYREMAGSVRKYGGFYIGRYEASRGGGGLPASKRVDGDTEMYWRYSPQSATELCQQLYTDNETVSGFFLWGVNWDTALAWLVDTGNKTENDVAKDSTSWGNYSNDAFSKGARGDTTGMFEEAKANNIYDLAGNNWEWTQERSGANYVMRGGGYNLMGGSCPGSEYPAAIRDPLPGNDHHPNVVFRTGLYLTGD